MKKWRGKMSLFEALLEEIFTILIPIIEAIKSIMWLPLPPHKSQTLRAENVLHGW